MGGEDLRTVMIGQLPRLFVNASEQSRRLIEFATENSHRRTCGIHLIVVRLRSPATKVASRIGMKPDIEWSKTTSDNRNLPQPVE